MEATRKSVESSRVCCFHVSMPGISHNLGTPLLLLAATEKP